MQNKPKTHVLTISRTFPAYHPRRGEETGFVEKIKAGEAVLSLRYWEGKPYNSPQVEFARLTAKDGVGVQETKISSNFFTSIAATDFVAQNDGLSFEDFRSWFRLGKYDLSQPMAIIYFTKFRY